MAKKRRKGAVRRLKVVTTDGVKDFMQIYKYASLEKSDTELVNFVENMNSLSVNEVKRISRTDWEDITNAEEDFEKVEGLAVYDAGGKLITSKMTFSTGADIAAMLDGATGELSNDSDTTAYTIAVYDNKGKLTNTQIQFATTNDVAAMLADDSPADFDNTDGYTLAMVTSDGKLTNSGVGFATADDMQNFLAQVS